MASVTQRGLTFVGLDVHKDSISAGVLRPRAEIPEVERIFNDEELIRRFIGRFRQPKLLRVCYEAGPTGFGLARLLGSMSVSCEVVAPALIPKAAGDRVKTDAGLPSAGAAVSGRGADSDPGAESDRGGGARPVPGAGRPGR